MVQMKSGKKETLPLSYGQRHVAGRHCEIIQCDAKSLGAYRLSTSVLADYLAGYAAICGQL